MNNGGENTLLFIADISGFTRFINETEITHSSHIISELLEIIIDKNNINLLVAEIEGDAVLFYKIGSTTDVKELVDQSLKMFVAFQEHIKLYTRDRICQCGACVGVSNLSLKFIIHSGNVLVNHIQNRLQLMGKDVTLAHKLLKNKINSHEYILLTDSINIQDNQIKGVKFLPENQTYEDAGEIHFKYCNLENIKKEIPIPLKRKITKKRTNSPVSATITIKASINLVHATLIDLSRRSLWKTEINFDSKNVERIGTVHECILPQGTVEGHVVDNIVKDNEIIYEENIKKFNLLVPSATEIYYLKPISENSCQMDIEVHIHTNPFWRFLLRIIFKKGINESLDRFRSLCEKTT